MSEQLKKELAEAGMELEQIDADPERFGAADWKDGNATIYRCGAGRVAWRSITA